MSAPGSSLSRYLLTSFSWLTWYTKAIANHTLQTLTSISLIHERFVFFSLSRSIQGSPHVVEVPASSGEALIRWGTTWIHYPSSKISWSTYVAAGCLYCRGKDATSKSKLHIHPPHSFELGHALLAIGNKLVSKRQPRVKVHRFIEYRKVEDLRRSDLSP